MTDQQKQDMDLFNNWINRTTLTLPICQPTKHELMQMKLLLKSGKTTRTNRDKTYCIAKGWTERGNWHYTIKITDQTSCKLFEYTPSYYE